MKSCPLSKTASSMKDSSDNKVKETSSFSDKKTTQPAAKEKKPGLTLWTGLNEDAIKEQISIAHVTAIAARAGITITKDNQDQGHDGLFKLVKSINGKQRNGAFPLAFQLKASSRRVSVKKNGDVTYLMTPDAYNKIVDYNAEAEGEQGAGVPCILIVCWLHEKGDDNWVNSAQEALTLKNCCFWKYLPGSLKQVENNKTVALDKLLTPEELLRVMRLREENKKLDG
ncbi:MAG TPA: DUF4365 domain-containing protein [Candidatus Melainabacteria bacterium]|nr:MAG: hypothetical protein DKT66_28375 [Candidatus Melainabacteria bacterium]HIA51757.1 DUF4365 domain-containing protein [Candidatus Melainabacteria bacterium]HIN65573.1 DUF4365 domain-containing protein [Candidatus Obscuribacterales bacterium]